MYYKDGRVNVETEDQCMTCDNFKKGVACPLLHALALGAVSFEGSLTINDCGFYKEFKRHLKIVAQ